MITQELYDNYTAILREELVPAMGCTEPIAIAYAGAKACNVLGENFTHLHVSCSGNIIKNVKGVIVPNSGGQKGIEAASVLGAVGGDAEKVLEVIAGADDKARALTRKLVREKVCDVSLAENVPNLYIEVTASGQVHTASVRIENHHTSITRIERDGTVLYESESQESGSTASSADRSMMKLCTILQYADTVKIDDVREILERQVEYNSRISQEGLDNKWGACVGKTIIET